MTSYEPIPDRAGAQREAWILRAVREGRAEIEWWPICLTNAQHAARVWVLRDALKIGGVRVNVTAATQQLIADSLKASLTTPMIEDAIYQHARQRPRPVLMQPDGSTAQMVAHSRGLDALLMPDTPGIVAPVGKSWVISNRVTAKRAANYGYHSGSAPHRSVSLGTPVWQPLATAHDYRHTDYSQTVRLARRACVVDGAEWDLHDLYRHAELSSLVSHEGQLSMVRLPVGVPPLDDADDEPTQPQRPTPPAFAWRTLRRGSSGPDVHAWQLVLQRDGHRLAADGVFGPLTERITKDWQAGRGLIADGIVGPRTRAKIGVSTAPASPASVHPVDALVVAKLDPAIQDGALGLLRRARDAGIKLRLTSGLRTLAEQARLWEQGRTRPGAIVTNAKPGQSWHNWGLAFDVAPLDERGQPHWPNDRALWLRIGELGESVGLQWGGRWSTPDLPHFQHARGITFRDAAAGRRPVPLGAVTP